MKVIKLAAFCLLLASCNKNTIVPATDITVIDDGTDSLIARPLLEPIINLFDFHSLPNQAARMRMVLLTDMHLNPVQDISLESGHKSDDNNRNDDIRYRERIIYSFQQAVQKAIEEFPGEYPAPPRSYSECFATVASELEILAESKASQKYLIVFSDLQENEEDFSCYSEEDRELLATNPEKVERILLKRRSMPKRLVGITVYFVFQPKDRAQDQGYIAMVSIYQKLLKARGARVVVQVSNTKFHN